MLTVVLSHGPNPDINMPGVKRGYWVSPIDIGVPMHTAVASLSAASARCRKYIERNELGGGNWTGGDVYDGGTLVGYVSYSGRVWSDREHGKELVA